MCILSLSRSLCGNEESLYYYYYYYYWEDVHATVGIPPGDRQMVEDGRANGVGFSLNRLENLENGATLPAFEL